MALAWHVDGTAIVLAVQSGFAAGAAQPYELHQGAADDGGEVLGLARGTGVVSGEVDQRGAEASGERGSRGLGELALDVVCYLGP